MPTANSYGDTMSGSLYAGLDQLYGTPLSDAELASRGQAKLQLLQDQQLLPSALDSAALATCDNLQNIRAAVVGGGFAGLCAAWYLLQAGVAVVLFEAADRLGGRVLTDRQLVPGKVVEAGAELIGANHALWIALASIFSLDLEAVSSADEYRDAGLHVQLRLGGHDLSDDEQLQLYTDMTQVIDLIGEDARGIDQVKPWLSPGADAFDQKSVGQRLDELLTPASGFLREALEFTLGNDNCAPVASQSYLGLLALVSAGRMGDDQKGLRGYWNCTETHRCGGGNDQLATQLAAGLSDIRLNTPVTKITITDDSVGLEWTQAGAGGSESFDYAVLAAPPTSWPDVVSEPHGWDPSEYTMSHGPAVKYLSALDTPFWIDQGLAPSAQWDKLGSLLEGTDRQPPTDTGGFALSVFSGGDNVLDATAYPPLLGQLFPGYAATAARLVDWPNTDWIGTGYSVPSRGQVGGIGRGLVTPYADLMMFAGEQCCVPFFGYMEGALESGARAARDIIAAICPAAVTAS